MSALEQARWVFQEAGLAFPYIPAELAARLKEIGRWWFSTRDDDISPYILDKCVKEAKRRTVEDFAVLAHSGYGANSYAIQYFLVYGKLRMFLFLGWGGVYMDPAETAAQIKRCFALADAIVQSFSFAGATRARPGRVTIVASDFYSSYWTARGNPRKRKRAFAKTPAEVLQEVLRWLNGDTRSFRSATTERDRH